MALQHAHSKLHMGAVLKPLFTFYIKPEHVRSKTVLFCGRERSAKARRKGNIMCVSIGAIIVVR